MLEQPVQPLSWVATDPQEQDRLAAVSQRLVVPERLRQEERAEGVRRFGNREIAPRLHHDQQEDSARRAALVELADGVQVARPVAERGGYPEALQEQPARFPQAAVHLRHRIGERQQCQVAAEPHLIQEPLDRLRDAGRRDAADRPEAKALAQAQAAYLEAVEALRKTLLRAPMSGRIVRLEVEAGETAVMGTINTPGSRLLTIADPSALEVRARVDETDVPRIHIGDSANVELDALPGRTFAGRVVRIGESAVANERRGSPADAGAGGRSVDYEVVVELLERDPAVRPDMSAAVRIVTARRTGALAVPIVAVAVRDSSGRRPSERPDSARTAAREREGVFVVRGGVARFAPVTLGIAGEGYFEVLRGVREGDTIVAGPYDAVRTLESGRKVRPLSIGSP